VKCWRLFTTCGCLCYRGSVLLSRALFLSLLLCVPYRSVIVAPSVEEVETLLNDDVISLVVIDLHEYVLECISCVGFHATLLELS
jgi:hypothetical protein